MLKEEPLQEKRTKHYNDIADKQLLSPEEGPIFNHDIGYGELNMNLIEQAKYDAAPVIPNLPTIKFSLPTQENYTTATDEIKIIDENIEIVGCSTKVRRRDTIILNILSLSGEPKYQDVQIICKNGVVKTNSFLLASIFPLFKDLLKSANYESPFVISIPDMDKKSLCQMFHSLANKHEEIHVPSNLWNYLSNVMRDELKKRRKEINGGGNHTILKTLVGVNSNDVKILVQPKILKNELIKPNEPKILKKIDVKTLESREQPNIKIRKSRKMGTTRQEFNPQGLFKLNGTAVEIDKITGKFVQDIPFEVIEESYVELNNKEKIFNLNKCVFCLKEFNTWEELKIHEISHPIANHFNCLICNNQCRKPKLKNHYLWNHLRPDDYEKCPKCRKPQLRTTLERHLARVCHEFKPARASKKNRTCDKEAVLCPECGESVRNISYHIKYHHRNLKETSCQICGKLFNKPDLLRNHLKSHAPKTPCPKCGVLVKNMRLHSMTAHVPDSEKKFQCQDCDRGFVTKANLENHRMNVHLKTRPYQCRYGCSNAYNDTSNRNSHEKKTHGQLFQSEQRI